MKCHFVRKVDYWLYIVTFKATTRRRQLFVIGRKPVLLALNHNFTIHDLQQSIIYLFINMIETIYCGKRTVWLYTRPRHTARYTIKTTVAWREYNYLNGFELPTDNWSCIYYRRWLLLCLCVRIAHRNNAVPPGRRHSRHCRSSCVWLNKTHFIETFVDTPRTYHWFSYYEFFINWEKVIWLLVFQTFLDFVATFMPVDFYVCLVEMQP